jgi:hypothetical protein
MYQEDWRAHGEELEMEECFEREELIEDRCP